MADRPRVRADAHSLASLLVARGVDLTDLEPGIDGWHSVESLSAGIAAALAAHPRRARPEGRPSGDTLTPEQAYDTGRISARSLADWQARYEHDPAGTGQTLATLHPVLEPPTSSPWATDPTTGDRVLATALTGRLATSETPMVDAVEEALWGPSIEQADRADRVRAEAEYQDILAAERAQAADPGLTSAERTALFGGD